VVPPRDVAGEAGAVHERAVMEETTGRVCGAAKAVMGAAAMGARILLRECGRGRRRHD
jgi:hypothetical protein